MHTEAMLASHPAAGGKVGIPLVRAIEACFDCTEACTSCADACLGEDMVSDLRQCIRLDLDCAALCATTGAVLSRQTGSNGSTVRLLLEACIEACRVCGDECGRHSARHEHCRICAETCRRCEDACRQALSAI